MRLSVVSIVSASVFFILATPPRRFSAVRGMYFSACAGYGWRITAASLSVRPAGPSPGCISTRTAITVPRRTQFPASVTVTSTARPIATRSLPSGPLVLRSHRGLRCRLGWTFSCWRRRGCWYGRALFILARAIPVPTAAARLRRTKQRGDKMAAVPVTFQGILFFSDVGVGGGPMPGGPHPSHPIAPGGSPPGYWGGVAPPYPDQGLPGQPPGIWPSPGHPSHPIAPGGQPPGIWPSPGHPSHPIAPGGGPSQGPGFPTAPIVLPPYEPGGPPVSIWPNPGNPAHPIVLPPPPPPPDDEAIKPPPETGGWAYAPEYGWGFFPAEGSAGPKR
jgi:hypothetical protein